MQLLCNKHALVPEPLLFEPGQRTVWEPAFAGDDHGKRFESPFAQVLDESLERVRLVVVVGVGELRAGKERVVLTLVWDRIRYHRRWEELGSAHALPAVAVDVPDVLQPCGSENPFHPLGLPTAQSFVVCS